MMTPSATLDVYCHVKAGLGKGVATATEDVIGNEPSVGSVGGVGKDDFLTMSSFPQRYRLSSAIVHGHCCPTTATAQISISVELTSGRYPHCSLGIA
jgi:hypothetical protein